MPYSTSRYGSTLRIPSKYRMSGARKHVIDVCSSFFPSLNMNCYAVLAVFLWCMLTNCGISVYVNCNDPCFCPSSNGALWRTCTTRYGFYSDSDYPTHCFRDTGTATAWETQQDHSGRGMPEKAPSMPAESYARPHQLVVSIM